jgi:NitT/TauT family transport system substrate-binding protein
MRLLAFLLLPVLALVTLPGGAGAQSPAVLHVATGGKESDAQVYYAQELGYFAKAGLSVDIQTMANGAAIASAVAAGALQIGSSNILAIATARQRGLPFVFIAPGGQYRDSVPTTQLVTALASPIRTGKDLNGKTIGSISLRALDQFSAMAWIDANGGDSSTVKFIEIPTSEMAAALDRGTIDAAQMAEPFLSANRGKVRLLGKSYGAVAKQFLIAGWFAKSDWVAQNADVVKRFDDAIAQSAQWANANPAKAGAILEKYAKIQANPDANHLNYARTLEPSAIAPVLELGLKYKALAQALPAADLIATTR